jgi:hypothetical protein
MAAALLTTYFPNYQSLADIVLPNLSGYCQKHGYKFLAPVGKEKGDAYGFQKMKFLLDFLNKKEADVVLCTDLDILITNYTKKFEDFAGEGDLFITKDVNGINAGSFIVKNTERGRRLISDILSHNGREDNEQKAIQQHFSHELTILPHPSINSYMYECYGAPCWGYQSGHRERPTHEEGDWKPGDFLLHLPGLQMERRIKILTDRMKDVIYE